MSRARTVLRTGVWSALIQVVTLITQVVTVPFFMGAWGAELYGDWLTLSALVSYLSLADGGMQNYIINRLTQLGAKEQWDELRKELSSATMLYAVVLVAVVVLALLLAVAWPYESSLAGRPILTHGGISPAGIVFLLGLQVVSALASGMAAGLYRVVGRADAAQGVVFVQRLVQLIATAVVLWLKWSPGAMAVVHLVVATGAAVVMFIDTSRLDSRLIPSWRGGDWRLARSFLVPSLLFLVGMLSQNLVTQGTVLMIAHVATGAEVVVFATSRTVANVLRQPVSLINGALAPEITRLDAISGKERIAFSHRLAGKVTSAVVFPAAAALLFVGVEVYGLWTRHRAEPNTWLMRLLLIDAMANTPAFVSALFLMSTNRHERLVWVALLAGVATVVGAGLLYPLMGVAGAGAAILGVNMLVSNVVAPVWFCATVGETFGSFVRKVYLPLSVAAVLLVAVGGGVHLAIPDGFLGILSVSAACAVTGALAFWFIVFDREEKAFLLGLVGRRRQPANETAALT